MKIMRTIKNNNNKKSIYINDFNKELDRLRTGFLSLFSIKNNFYSNDRKKTIRHAKINQVQVFECFLDCEQYHNTYMIALSDKLYFNASFDFPSRHSEASFDLYENIMISIYFIEDNDYVMNSISLTLNELKKINQYANLLGKKIKEHKVLNMRELKSLCSLIYSENYYLQDFDNAIKLLVNNQGAADDFFNAHNELIDCKKTNHKVISSENLIISRSSRKIVNIKNKPETPNSQNEIDMAIEKLNDSTIRFLGVRHIHHKSSVIYNSVELITNWVL